MTNLKEARDKGKLEEFIKEHEKDEKGDDEALSKAIDSLSKTTKKTSNDRDHKDHKNSKYPT